MTTNGRKWPQMTTNDHNWPQMTQMATDFRKIRYDFIFKSGYKRENRPPVNIQYFKIIFYWRLPFLCRKLSRLNSVLPNRNSFIIGNFDDLDIIVNIYVNKNLDRAQMAPGILTWERRKLYRELYILHGQKSTGWKWLRKY